MTAVLEKKCSKCNEVKPRTGFVVQKDKKSGLSSQCKVCRNKHYRDSYDPEKKRQYLEENRDVINSKKRKHYEKNRERLKAKQRQYRKDNLEKERKRNREYHRDNKEKTREYRRRRYNTDIQFKLRHSLGTRLRQALKGQKKRASILKYIGCSLSQLKSHLESQFEPGMTWENWTTDGWHIDHIVPLDSFDLTVESEVFKACHYLNLQPLWSDENLKKSNKVL